MEEEHQQNPNSNSPITLPLSSTSPPPPNESDTREPAFKKPKMSTTTTSDDDTTSDKPRRYKRRKVAIFFAYCGVGYQGMQKNPGAKTIEGDLEEALYLSGAVPEEERGQHKRYDWARSARTDKGVSAVGQVVSGKFFVDPPGFVQRLNSILPPQIRIFGYKRATPTFSSKKFCDRRRYVYLLPVFALDPSRHRDRESVKASLGSGEGELVKCVECSERGRKVLGVVGNRRGMRNVALMLDAENKVSEGVESECLNNASSILQVKEEECVVNVENEMKNAVEAQVLVKSGDALMLDAENKVEGVESEYLNNASLILQVKEEECSVNVENEMKNGDEGNLRGEKENTLGKELRNDVNVVKNAVEAEDLVKLGVSSTVVKVEEGNLDGEKENEMKNAQVLAKSVVSSTNEGNLLGEIENTVGKELRNVVNVVKSETLVQSEVQLNKEAVVNAEVAVKEEELDGKCEFKYGEEVKERLNRMLKYYEGTHNFHNFTTRTKAEDPSAKRYIVSFQANTTLTLDGIEFIKCEVVGQSFMLHQIRKMMGMVVAVMRNFAPESIFETAFDRTVYLNVPTAPEVGLYLDECFFTSYNNKWNGTHEELSMKSYAEEAEEFKLKYIYSHIAETEHKEGSVAIWLHSLNQRNYPDLCQPSPQRVTNPGT